MNKARDIKAGDIVTAKQTNKDGEMEYVTGELITITSNGKAYIEKKFPKRAQYLVKIEDIIIKGASNGR